MPKWQVSGKTIARALKDPYVKTVEIFDENYPLDGEFQFLFEGINNVGQEQEKEIGILRKRFGFRMLMFNEFIGSEEGSEVYVLKSGAVEINNLISDGKRDEVESMIKGKQSEMMLDGLFEADVAFRGRLAYSLIMMQGNRGIVFLSNPEMPQFFVLLYIDIINNQSVLDSIEMHKLEALKAL